jgi:predicted nuclease of predicted toxin-antitoxin system
MSVKIYMDVHVKRAVTDGLRLRGVDVLTAQEDGAAEFEDPALLDRATELNRVLFSQDDDLLREANKRQQTGEHFAGVIYAHQLNITVGQCIDDLELIAKATEPDEWLNNAVYLPLS